MGRKPGPSTMIRRIVSEWLISPATWGKYAVTDECIQFTALDIWRLVYANVRNPQLVLYAFRLIDNPKYLSGLGLRLISRRRRRLPRRRIYIYTICKENPPEKPEINEKATNEKKAETKSEYDMKSVVEATARVIVSKVSTSYGNVIRFRPGEVERLLSRTEKPRPPNSMLHKLIYYILRPCGVKIQFQRRRGVCILERKNPLWDVALQNGVEGVENFIWQKMREFEEARIS